MLKYYKKIKNIPDDFCDETVKRISRIESNHSVVGVIFMKKGVTEMYTVPETMAQGLSKKLPALDAATHRALTEITSLINKMNPIVDRIMEDESVEGVVMTNKEGVPVLTNVSVTNATNYALSLHRYGTMAQNYVKELDPFDEVLVVRLKTKKVELMLAPNPEFNIIVVQHARHKNKEKLKKKVILAGA